MYIFSNNITYILFFYYLNVIIINIEYEITIALQTYGVVPMNSLKDHVM